MLWMACDSSGVPANGHSYGAETLVSVRCKTPTINIPQ
jgi:hypothetical protein